MLEKEISCCDTTLTGQCSITFPASASSGLRRWRSLCWDSGMQESRALCTSSTSVQHPQSHGYFDMLLAPVWLSVLWWLPLILLLCPILEH
jgi:hypothetical protein